MAIRAKFMDGMFHPLERQEEIARRYSNKEVRIEILPKSSKKEGNPIALSSLRGALKGMNITSVELQHKAKNMW